MRPEMQLLAIETGADFVERLRVATNDTRLIVEGSAEEVGRHLASRGLDHAELVLSGLPFCTLELEDAARIMRATAAALAPIGYARCLSDAHRYKAAHRASFCSAEAWL